MAGNVKNIFLVRHGESEGNINLEIHEKMADMDIPLSRKGQVQALAAGHFLRGFLRQPEFAGSNIRLWKSPYVRTEQTADQIVRQLGMRSEGGLLEDVREDNRVREQQFGLFDGLTPEQIKERHPDLYDNYAKHYNTADKRPAYNYIFPSGESRGQVAERCKDFIGSIGRDADPARIEEGKDVIDSVIVVSHGLTTRTIAQTLLHKDIMDFQQETNPGNCNIRHIQWDEEEGRYVDHGYIYQGQVQQILGAAALAQRENPGSRIIP